MAGGASVAWTWGSTAAERALPFPCDRFLGDPDASLYRAIDVDAPPSVVFRWLCQLRVAPYSYDWIDNFGRRSPQRLTPGLEQLAVGQSVMSLFTLVDFERDRHVTAITRPALKPIFGEIAASYVVAPRAAGASRLLVKLLVRHPSGPIGWTIRVLLPWGDLVMMRRQLLNLKRLAEA
jgi:hypothetical protein